jgi:GT2 family glycosyltransferase
MYCDIVIPVWNQLSFTKDCLDSIFANTDKGYGIIAVDNASDTAAAEYLDGLKSAAPAPFTVIRNSSNLGFVKAVNQGIAASRAPYVCLLNNDTVVTNGWLKAMIEAAESSADIGIVNPSSNNLGQRPADGEPIEAYAGRLAAGAVKTVDMATAVGFCMLIKRGLIEKIGPFDEIYGMGNFEDTDFSRRAARAGYRVVRAVGSYVYHREGSSFRHLKDSDDGFKRNRAIYEFRWGRPKRIAYLLPAACDANTLKRIRMESARLAADGNWVFFFFAGEASLPEHSNVIKVALPDKRFRLNALFSIIKKKKRFDEIFVNDEKFGRLLEALRFVHGADVRYY